MPSLVNSAWQSKTGFAPPGMAHDGGQAPYAPTNVATTTATAKASRNMSPSRADYATCICRGGSTKLHSREGAPIKSGKPRSMTHATHEVQNQPPPLQGYDLFTSDPVLV